MVMKITPHLFEAFLKCATKCWLRSKGEPSTGNEYADWFRSQNESYRTEGIKRLVASFSPIECVTNPANAENPKMAKWRLAVDFAAKSQNLESTIHAVDRVPSEGRGKAATFIPIRFIFTNKLTRDDKLLLAFDDLVLSELLGRGSGVGKIIHGDNHATLKVKTSALTGEVRKQTEKIAALLANPAPPDLVLNRHCGECEFQNRCRQKAIEKDDLSLLAGMSEKERKKLHSKGIFTVTQFSYTFRPRRRPKRLRDKKEKYHHSLKALAIREKKIHIVGTPELKIEGTPVYLDVEGLPDRHFYYLIGVRIGNGEAAVQHSLWADTLQDEGKIWREFLEILCTVERPALIHYGSYETIFLRAMVEHYGEVTAESVASKAVDSAFNILSHIFAQVYFPTYSNGLKEIARHLNFEWSDSTASGTTSIVWRMDWVQSHTDSLKQKLISYNAEDCAALARTHESLLNLSANARDPANLTDFVHADHLSRDFHRKFKKNNFQFPEFEQINRAAYWDYQRERVLVKSSERLNRLVRKVAAKRKLKPRINKTVDLPDPPSCPKCGGRTLYKHHPATKTVIDVRFGSGSVKRWETKYRFNYLRCPMCRAVFQSPYRTWDGQKFGSNLRAFSVYQNIELRMPLHQVTAFLNSVFGFQLSATMVSKFKETAAAFYHSTREALLQSIIGGGLVHVDETRINLGDQAGYVWVFTNLEKAVYLYSASREGELVQRLLNDFNGVLVSDYYAVYDSLKCLQQKCLIHLIRDVNEDLFKEPFNTEFKELVGQIAILLKPMVETVDRFGLKRRFLQKHKSEVDRFFRQLSRRTYVTELALKCQQRLKKNRETLFTFLDHDGVPWNNNNAEHAVKAFALLRRNFDGVSTEKGIKEYLILLSVCQTCKYQGLDFLDFLRSGETDIQTFAESKERRKRRKAQNSEKTMTG
jgi:predicted RecB family nuclease